MDIVRFNEHVICSQVDNVNNYLQTKLFKDGTTIEELAASEAKDVFYIDRGLVLLQDETNAAWAFVKLPRIYAGKPIFFIAKFYKETNLFDGYMIGNLSHITGGLDKTYNGPACDYYKRFQALLRYLEDGVDLPISQTTNPTRTSTTAVAPSVAKSISKVPDVVSEMVDEIYDNLLLNNFKTKEGLGRFIKIIGARLCALREVGDMRYMVENGARYAIVNTGLLDSYKEDIYVLYRYNVTADAYHAYKIVKCKQDWIDNGFEKNQITNLPPVKFFDAENSTIGDISVDDIDIPTGVFHHIIIDNRERLERIIGSENSTDIIADRIREAINVGIKMLERDSTYIKPYYTTVSGFSWAMPLHIQQSLSEEPEFVLIFVKNGDFFTLKTVLPYGDQVKDSLTAVSLYGTKW